jgi:integrase
MGRNQQFEGIYAREASILINFNWEGRRHRERLDLRPTASNLKAAARLRDDILSAIKIDKFTVDDFAKHFPDSKWLHDKGGATGHLLSGVTETWLTIAGQELAETTIKEYRNTMNRYWLPTFGQEPISTMTYEDIALHVASKQIKNAKTFNNVMTPLRGVFAYAVATKKIAVDPTAQIPTRKHQKAKPDPLEVREVELVLQHIQKHYDEQWHNYFEFAFFSGLRPSELIAFKWPNVDFQRKSACVDAARVRAVDKDSKTHRARDIDLQTRALQALIRQKKHTLLKGEYVFNNPFTGERFHDTGPAVQLVWRPALRGVGLRDRDAKQTRHTFATMCLHAGVNPAYVADQMGHTDTRMFFEVYSKWIKGQANTREISKLDALLAQEDSSQSIL